MKINFTIYSFLILSFFSAKAQIEYVDVNFGINNGYTISQMTTGDLAMHDIVEVNSNLYAISTNFNGDFFLLKYNLNGEIDTSFGENGVVATTHAANVNYLAQVSNKLRKTADNKLLIITNVYPNNYEVTGVNVTLISKVNLDGTLDESYGSSGRFIGEFPLGLVLIGVEQSNTDEVIITGYNDYHDSAIPNYEVIILKVTAQGIVDTTFGTNGYIHLPYNFEVYTPVIAHYKENSIYTFFTDYQQNQYISKYDLGSLSYDLSFGTNGFLIVGSAELGQEMQTFMLNKSTSDLYVCGVRNVNANYVMENEIVVKKYSDAILNPAFGSGGMVTFQVLQNSNSKKSVHRISADANKFLIDGQTYTFDSASFDRTFFAQLNLDGTLDSDFGLDGVIINPLFNSLDRVFNYKNNVDSIITCGSCPSLNGFYPQVPCLIKFLKSSPLNTSEQSKPEISFYPNPVVETVTFNGDSNITGIDVFDYSGRLIKKYIAYQNSINLIDLQAGMYIAKVQTTLESFKIKLLKK